MSPVCSFIRTVRQVAPSALGLTQASRVIPFVRSSVFESATLTMLVVPLKLRAPPNLPVVDHVVPLTVPLLPFPERSVSVLPEP